MKNILNHDPDSTLIVDIESDDLSVTWDPDTRVYLVGVMSVTTGDWKLYKSVKEFTANVDPHSTLVFHNASFDLAALMLRGLPYNQPFYCTMVGSHTLNPGSSDEHSLAVLQPQTKSKLRDLLTAEGYDMRGVLKGEEYKWYGTGKSKVDGITEQYLVKDLSATRDEYIRQVTEYTNLDKPRTLQLLLDTNIPYVRSIIDMGKGVNIRYNYTVSDTLSEASERSMKVCLTLVGYEGNPTPFPAGTTPFPKAGMKAQGDYCKMEPFNPNSDAQVIRALKRLYSWVPLKETKSGAPSVSSEVLEALDNPLAGALIEQHKSSKLLQFCKALKDVGIVRPRYNQCATRTTRLSCSNPNIQQIPARDATGKQLRKMFVPRDGYTFIVGDQSGFQLRILAAYMSYYFDDNRLVDCFNNDEDVHQFFADIYGIPRKVAKNVTFGYLFGAGVNKMTATANRGNPNPIQSTVIKGALAALDDRMPALNGVRDLFVEHARENNGIIYDWLGTRYTIPELMFKDKGLRASGERKVLNYMIQGFEASCFRILQNEATTCVESYMARQAFAVHDEVGYECILGLEEFLIPELDRIMSPPFSRFTPEVCDVGGLKLECKFNAGQSWYEAKEE
jgi:DNA polymerase I-like protein with 3'-5' exonuclease and polymerase domains